MLASHQEVQSNRAGRAASTKLIAWSASRQRTLGFMDGSVCATRHWRGGRHQRALLGGFDRRDAILYAILVLILGAMAWEMEERLI